MKNEILQPREFGKHSTPYHPLLRITIHSGIAKVLRGPKEKILVKGHLTQHFIS